MSDNANLLKLLREALLYESASNPTEEEVEEFMSEQPDTSAGDLKEMHAHFAERVLGKLHPTPVKEVEKDITLGRWVEAERKKARLPVTFVADALDLKSSFVERLEKGEILPWTIPVTKGSEIAILFRIHFEAFTVLTENSFRAKKRLERLLASSSNTERMGLPLGTLAYKSLPPDEEISDEIKEWLDAVRRILEEKQATHLLD